MKQHTDVLALGQARLEEMHAQAQRDARARTARRANRGHRPRADQRSVLAAIGRRARRLGLLVPKGL